MFGQQDDQQQNDHIPDHSIDGALTDDTPTVTPPSDDPPSDSSDSWQHPGVPIIGNDNSDSPAGPPNPDPDSSSPSPEPTHRSSHGNDTSGTNDLIDIKQKALHQLTPLVGHLDQSPEEKFRTTMMMIQASDDHSLVKTAYEAANAIEDEKMRAQALLDIVNEINYFTQNPEQ